MKKCSLHCVLLSVKCVSFSTIMLSCYNAELSLVLLIHCLLWKYFNSWASIFVVSWKTWSSWVHKFVDSGFFKKKKKKKFKKKLNNSDGTLIDRLLLGIGLNLISVFAHGSVHLLTYCCLERDQQTTKEIDP